MASRMEKRVMKKVHPVLRKKINKDTKAKYEKLKAHTKKIEDKMKRRIKRGEKKDKKKAMKNQRKIEDLQKQKLGGVKTKLAAHFKKDVKNLAKMFALAQRKRTGKTFVGPGKGKTFKNEETFKFKKIKGESKPHIGEDPMTSYKKNLSAKTLKKLSKEKKEKYKKSAAKLAKQKCKAVKKNGKLELDIPRKDAEVVANMKPSAKAAYMKKCLAPSLEKKATKGMSKSKKMAMLFMQSDDMQLYARCVGHASQALDAEGDSADAMLDDKHAECRGMAGDSKLLSHMMKVHAWKHSVRTWQGRVNAGQHTEAMPSFLFEEDSEDSDVRELSVELSLKLWAGWGEDEKGTPGLGLTQVAPCASW
jgi:hypothetical protein